jgi:hypothetical protein
MEESYGCEDDMGGGAGAGGFYESSAYDSYNATGYVSVPQCWLIEFRLCMDWVHNTKTQVKVFFVLMTLC